MLHRYDYVVTRDGIRLATDIYLPGATGRYPTVIQRTPYGKYEERAIMYAEWMAEYGYACVIQDVRGRHDSDGDWHPYENHEDTDGYDTIDWVIRQPWSTGRVGFSGSSYLAYTGYMAALSGHQALKALIARVPATGLYHHHFYMGGIFSLGRLSWGTLANRRVTQSSLENGVQSRIFEKLIKEDPGVLMHLPVVEIGDRFSMPIPCWRTWLQHWTEDEYWRRLEIRHQLHRIKIPTYHVGGWHDDFCSVPLENFLDAGGAGAAREQRLLMGMWPHGLNLRTDHGGTEYGPQAVIDLFGREKQFLDPYLQGVPRTLQGEPPVRLFIMGLNEWRNYQTWPPQVTHPVRLYLRANGLLSADAPMAESPDTYVYDPHRPTPQPWDFGEPDLPEVTGWEPDPRPGEARLLYASRPLDNPLAIIGPVRLCLHAQTDARDTDWFAWMAWEDPSTGLVRLLTYGGCIRARFRYSFERPKLLKPGEKFTYEMNMGHTARVLPTGARFLLCLQSSGAPWYSRNLNTGGCNYTESDSVKAVQTIYHDSNRPSHVILSVAPGEWKGPHP
jgi:uncharacterized protein